MPRAKSGTGKKPTISPPPRYPSGELKPAEPEGIAPTLLKRLKDEVIPRAKDKRLGSELGLMHLRGIITETECEAGFLYAEDVGAWERLKGHPRNTARSASFESGFGRAELDLERLERMDPDTAKAVKAKLARRKKRIEKRYRKAQDKIPDVPNVLATLMYEVCCLDRPVNSVFHAQIKAQLSSLARDCYKLHEAEAAKPRRRHKPLTAEDLRQLAEATVEALSEYFRKKRAQVAFYRVQMRFELQSRVICAYGMAVDGTRIEHTITLKRPYGAKGPVIDTALKAAAEKMGWSAMCITDFSEIDPVALKAAIDKLRNKEVA